MRASLHRTMLRYGGDLLLHTASSGPVSGLDTLYLLLDDKGIRGLGEVRINIAYLNGLEAEDVAREALGVLADVNWSVQPEVLLAEIGTQGGASAPVRMLIDMALHDLLARRADVSLTTWLGGDTASPASYSSNQTLFISSDERFLSQAQTYVSRGFRDLKIRAGSGDFDVDIARLALLRQCFGTAIKLAIDANGAWNEKEAHANLKALSVFDLAYVEQPIAPGDPDALARLAERSSIPLMLDESVAGQSDVDAIIGLKGTLWAHLKLVKLGGIAPTRDAAARLCAAGVPFMIGQMNEGAVATAAALHLACATTPRFAELYGADGLENDPATGLAYAGGRVIGTASAGLGLTFDAAKTRLLREF